MEATGSNLRRRGTLLDLPRDIIQEILLQFSVKDLLKLKCVSKSLCSLISSESFVRAHLLKSSKEESFDRFKILTSGVCKPQHRLPVYLTREQPTDIVAARAERHLKRRRCPAYLLSEELTNRYDFFRECLEVRRGKCITMRSSNGLVCEFSVCGKKITLRNPSTRKYKKLPPPDFEKGIYGSATSCGFGYVESTGDYKVFALSLQRKIDGVYYCTAKVYSLKRDCWRTVDDNYALKTPMDLAARYLCGMLYWLRMFRNSKNGLSWDIISFDLEKEAFGITVEQPGELEDSSYTPQLGVFNGSLCVLCLHSICMTTDLWVLNQQSWTKIAIFPEAFARFHSYRLAVSTDGVICRDKEYVGLFYYLPNDMRRSRLRIVDLDMFDGVCVYVESLVSLGNSEEAGVSAGSIINFEMDKRRFEDLDGDDDDDDDLHLEVRIREKLRRRWR